MRLLGVAIAVATVGFQIADAGDSTLRIVGPREEVKSSVEGDADAKRETVARRDSIVKRESTLHVASAASPVSGRPESQFVERAAVSTVKSNDITNAMREAVALRDAINVPAPANASVRAKGVSNSMAPPTTMSALTLAKTSATATRPVSIEPAPAASAAVPVIRVPAQTALATSPMERNPTSPEPATSPVVRIPAPVVPAPSLVVRAPASLVPAPSTIVRAPAPVAPLEPPVAPAPPTIAPEPVRVAQLPAAIVPARGKAARTPSPVVHPAPPVAGIAAANATYHLHSPAVPPADFNGVSDTCPCDGAHEEYDVSDGLGCVYGPGQSGAQNVCGVDCGVTGAPCCAGWNSAHCIPWSLFGPGEYVGPSRSEHVSSYYLRVNDLLTLTYINSRQKIGERYRLGIGDRLQIESSVDESLKREVQIQPDGEITLPIVGEVMAAGKTVKELRDDLTNVFQETQRQPQITVTPLEINSGQQEIIKAVTSQLSTNGQAVTLKVTPEGTIQAPGIGSVYVQGLTLDELRSELEARYTASFGSGLLISPALAQRADSYVFVGGEVKAPGRYLLEGPTTATQAISSLAGSWNIGANLHQVVVFRRDENWCLKAIKIDVRAPLYGNDPCPVNDVWLRDNDLVLVPKSKILCATDVINLYMTRGVYAAFPVTFVQDLSVGSSVGTTVVTPPGP
jgi:polysaccharide export outer membrane protein